MLCGTPIFRNWTEKEEIAKKLKSDRERESRRDEDSRSSETILFIKIRYGSAFERLR
jgi:hypothetical protein